MKKLRIVVIAIFAVAAIMLAAHLMVHANWPELLRIIHGR
jgi:hypothetical protein